MTDLLSIVSQYLNIIVVVVCACVGYALKNAFPSFDNRFIPLASALLGVALSAWANWGFSPEILAAGLVSGLAATGLYEAIRNLIDKFSNSVKDGE